MGASSSKSSSAPKDVTPQAFKDLQQPFADVLANMVGSYIPQGTNALMQGYQGPTTTNVSAGEQNVLNQLGTLTGNIGSVSQQQQQAAQNPTQPGTPSGGFPGVPNTLPGTGQINPVTQVTGSQLPSPTVLNGSPAQSQNIQSLLSSTAASGSSAQNAAQFANDLGIAGGPQQSLGEFQQGLAGASQTGAFGGQASNPFLDSYIQSAQRNTQQALEETLSRTLPGRFALAGQQTQPGSSSAFDRAAAIATRGAADAMGDIATNINYNAYEAAAGREAEALNAELARRGQQGLQTQQLTSAAQQAQLDRALQAPQIQQALQQGLAQTELTRAQTEGQQAQTGTQQAQTGLTQAQTGTQNAQTGLVNAQTGLTGAQIGQTQAETGLTNAQTGLTSAQTGTQNAQTGLTQSQIQQNEVNTLISSLQAQALPRLIEDLGIERGMEAFNNQVNSLLSVLGITAGVTRPVVGQKSSSSSGSVSLK